jgi:hypothetical protein
MVKITVLYGHPDDPAASEEYYADTHAPLVQKIPGVRRFEAARAIATPDGSELPYHRIAELYFENLGADAGQPGLGRGSGDGRGSAELRHGRGDDLYCRGRRVS